MQNIRAVLDDSNTKGICSAWYSLGTASGAASMRTYADEILDRSHSEGRHVLMFCRNFRVSLFESIQELFGPVAFECFGHMKAVFDVRDPSET